MTVQTRSLNNNLDTRSQNPEVEQAIRKFLKLKIIFKKWILETKKKRKRRRIIYIYICMWFIIYVTPRVWRRIEAKKKESSIKTNTRTV